MRCAPFRQASSAHAGAPPGSPGRLIFFTAIVSPRAGGMRMQPVDEYNPNSRNPRYGVRADDSVYVYDNVLSCLAVAVTDRISLNMVGVHLTIMSGRNVNELTGVVEKLQAALQGPASGIYLIGAWTSIWKDLKLLPALQGISRNINVADVMAVNEHERLVRSRQHWWSKRTVVSTNAGGDVDAKMEKDGFAVKGYVKPLKAAMYMRVAFQRL
jgi:hypothetical protein